MNSFVVIIFHGQYILYRGEVGCVAAGSWFNITHGKSDPIVFPTIRAAQGWITSFLVSHTTHIITLDEFQVMRTMST